MIAKHADAPYQPGRRAMIKVKHVRTAECVVAGFRWHKERIERVCEVKYDHLQGDRFRHAAIFVR